MNENLIITIERQAGSGGRQIGKIIAEKMNAKCYDEELLERAAKDSGIAEELFHAHDEKPTSSFLYSLVMDTYSLAYNTTAYTDMPINHKIFLAQFDSIKKIAKEESCVIVGRCADYALADLPHVVSFFVCADEKIRLERLMKQRDLNERNAKDLMNRTDKDRSSYYNYYSSKKWGDARSYDFCINTSELDYDVAADIMLEMATRKIKSM
ncbi:MAG: cytidylate kinase-like family protein [Lachnospiraceae bacterium]|nr:cytidylate kinase-like family protein [Lachnospiraceae bacterium]